MLGGFGTLEGNHDVIGSGVGSWDYHDVFEGGFGGWSKLTNFEIDNTEGSKSGIV